MPEFILYTMSSSEDQLNPATEPCKAYGKAVGDTFTLTEAGHNNVNTYSPEINVMFMEGLYNVPLFVEMLIELCLYIMVVFYWIAS